MTNGRRTVNEVTSPSKSSINKTILAFGFEMFENFGAGNKIRQLADTRSRAHQGVAQIQLS